MKFLPRHKLYFAMSVGVLLLQLGVAAVAKPSLALTLAGAAFPCALLMIAILAVGENLRRGTGLLPLFWKLIAAGLATMLLSQIYWFHYDSVRQFATASPVPGDTLFLLAHVFFLSAIALRPHSSSAGRDLQIRWLDFALLTLWWFALYGYFSWPWQAVVTDFSKYNPRYYVLALTMHFILIGGLAVLAYRNDRLWRRLYLHLLIAFCLIAVGNLLLSVLIDHGVYYAGSFFDARFFLSAVWFTYLAGFGPALQPHDDPRPNREVEAKPMDRAHRHAGGADASIDRLCRLLRKGNPSGDYGVSVAAGVCGDVLDRDVGFLETEFAVAGTRSSCEPHAYVSRKSSRGAESNRAVAEAGRPGPAGGWGYS